MSYELTFTRGFKNGLEELPREIYPIIDRQLEWIQTDPFARNSNATRMRNGRSAFRVRIGKHVRMGYQVYSRQRRVELNGIGPRENFYDGRHGSATPLTLEEANAIRKEIQGVPGIKPVQPSRAERDLPVTVEALEWITDDELFLLHVPPEYWPTIVTAGTIERLQASGVDASIKVRIEDYWTSPLPTQVEKLYSLGAGQDAGAIAQQPLSHFLIALDPEQKQALQKIKNNGPYLLKGSAGTGKSLVVSAPIES